MHHQGLPRVGPASLPSPPVTPRKFSVSLSPSNDTHETSTPSPKRRKGSTRKTTKPTPEEREQYLERNRLAASKCRQKRKRESEGLETRYNLLKAKHEELEELEHELRNAVTRFKTNLLGHHNCGDPNVNAYLQQEAILIPQKYAQSNLAAYLSSPASAHQAPSQANFQVPSQTTFQPPSPAMMIAPPSFSSPGFSASGTSNISNPSLASPTSAVSFDSSFGQEAAGTASATMPSHGTNAFDDAIALRFPDPPLPIMGGECPCDQPPSTMMDSEVLSAQETSFLNDIYLIDPELDLGA
ncbi:bZIP transcription factor atfB [Aspergillus candidus]|uniref:BZIP domain-containing protein n=1 Tax=Aspergillus candidus TaxID=41067 RepID=A0A2I2FBR9_ASPCN|nr:hypothetical protein BDW47DRAFT_105777 [Aspergillus candidus]PLB38069.1 hypothetical protein BDW47DRAFT_105777 [Aspergillus candidus]